MYENKRIVVCIPCGRKRYLRVLVPYLLDKRSSVVDEIELWVNTDNVDDLGYLEELEAKFSPRIKRVILDKKRKLVKEVYDRKRNHVQFNDSICHFYKHCVEPNTVYVKLDDDMVYVHKDFFKNLLAEVDKERDRCFLFVANMFNLSLTSKILQDKGVIGTDRGICTDDLRCPVSCTDGKFAVYAHTTFLDLYEKGELDRLMLEHVDLMGRQRIGAIAWLGETFAEINGNIDKHDEKWITQELYRRFAKPIRFVGTALVSHFATSHQVAELEDNSDVLERYRVICVKETGLEL